MQGLVVHALLCDFGCSRVIDQSEYTTDLKGAVRYMAPELLYPQDGEDLDTFNPRATKESDVYAFSMLSYEVKPTCFMTILIVYD